MTVETFITNFGYLADAPNGVRKLRELILQLAVQGKLVPQDPKDEPASGLLERIEAEKARLVKEKIIRKTKIEPITPEDKSFELPPTWEWVRFGSIAQHNAGKTLDKGRNKGQLRDYITTSNLYWGFFDLNNVRKMPIEDNELDRCTARKGDLLIVEGGEAGRAAVWTKDYDVCFQNHIHRARFYGDIDPFYVYRFFEKLNLSGEIGQYRKGVGISNMSGKALASIAVPLPPLEEQKRIVAKVDQLMALCDELETRQQKQQQRRVRLNNATLDALLTAREPVEFADHWQRISTNFDLLYDHPVTIAKLRAAILQLAVQGKLVPQDPNDEPASVLLERIKAEKERLVEEKVIRKEKLLLGIGSTSIPFILPENWEWVRLGTICKVIEYGTSQKSHDHSSGVPVLRMNNIEGGRVNRKNLKYVNAQIKDLPKLFLKSGEILFNRTNSYELVGKAGVFEGEDDTFTFASYLIRATLFQEHIIPTFVNFSLNSSYFRITQIEPEITQQCGQANFNGTKLKSTLVPLPPIAEQHRIVAKVDQLMTLCDELEVKLNQTQQHSGKLMEATVQQLLVA